MVRIVVTAGKFAAEVTIPEKKAHVYLKEVRSYLELKGIKNVKATSELITTPVPVTIKGLDGEKITFPTWNDALIYVQGAVHALQSTAVFYNDVLYVGPVPLEKLVEKLRKQLQ